MRQIDTGSLFRALADPTRRAIFEELSRQGEQTVHALTRYAGVSQPAVSKHLVVLKRLKLVRHRRSGRETYYRTHPDALAPMMSWLMTFGQAWVAWPMPQETSAHETSAPEAAAQEAGMQETAG